ncbi:hypothetical protein D3C80_2144060 [compost metagenome]
MAVSGSANLYTEESDVNEIVGLEEGDIREIKHVAFPDGDELTVGGGLTVKLIPAREK